MSFFSLLNVHAENTTFYEAEFIDDIYISKYEYATGITYYLKSRFIRRSDNNEFVYCIEPFTLFQDNSIYNEVSNLDVYQKDKIKKIAHFGYGYKNHTESKWYAITQLMIWREANPSIGRYYFTDTLNGNEINIFTEEINEIEKLISDYNLNPLSSTPYNALEGDSFAISLNSMINYYQSDSEYVTIKNGNVVVSSLPEGEYEFILTRYENVNNKPLVFYTSPTSQTLFERGDLEDKTLLLKINFHRSKITINKVDADTETTTPQGEAQLDGAVFGIYNNKNKLLDEVVIENNTAQIDGLKFGTYYLKEISPGEGYELEEQSYQININVKNYIHEVTAYNKVIEKKLIINKKYGEPDNLLPEKNIDFEIYNSNGELIRTISTDENGHVETILPYGKYTIKQFNSTDGYLINDPIIFIVNNHDDEIIELVDYKIPVPNTHIEENTLLKYLKLLLLLLL